MPKLYPYFKEVTLSFGCPLPLKRYILIENRDIRGYEYVYIDSESEPEIRVRIKRGWHLFEELISERWIVFLPKPRIQGIECLNEGGEDVNV